MSVQIGSIGGELVNNTAKVHVWASIGGVEIHADPEFTLQPTEARNFAALLERACDEVGRMRAIRHVP